MSIINWISMNMFVDIAFVVFSIAVVWKFNKIEKKMSSMEDDIELTARNPRLARRQLSKINKHREVN